jgi:hypothetical protein
VLEKIAQSDAALGDILSRCIRTGNFCSYQPDPDLPIAWEFAATVIEPADQPTSSGDRAPARVDHPQAPLAALEVSPLSLAERTAFVGRETERFAIREVIDRALTGRGSLVMLGGGPGVGKTRLAMETRNTRCGLAFEAPSGTATKATNHFPICPSSRSLKAIWRKRQVWMITVGRWGTMRPNWPSWLQPFGGFFRIFRNRRNCRLRSSAALFSKAFQRRRSARLEHVGSCTYLRTFIGPESTLALLIDLANRVAQLPVVIIGTYRDGYSDNNPAFVRTLEELIRLGVRPLKLGGLSKDAVAQMLNGLSQHRVPESLVNLIFEESQGNPFFVEEVYRHLIEEGKVFDAAGQFRTDIEIDEIDVPENVRLIIGRRLERLDQNEKRVLAAAAVIGRSFSFELLTATSQIDVDELFTVIEKAQQMGIIVPSSEGPDQPFTFTHELVRQTLLAGISAPRRQWLHAGVVDAIELVYPGAVDERAGEIADHLLKAGSFADRQTPIGWLRPAGKGAFEAAAFEQAQRSFRSAVSHQGAAGFAESADSADLLANLAMAERGLRRRAAGLANLREALEIYLNLGDREMIGRGLSELTDSFFRTRPFQEAAETARRRLAYVGADVSADRARLPAVGHTLAAAAGCERPMRRCGKR